MKNTLLTSIFALISTVSASAITFDLDLRSGTTSGTINSAVFEIDNFQATGTGVFNPFLDMKHQGNEGSEAAYNSGDWTLDGNNHRDQWNSNLMTSSLTSVVKNSISYFMFSLDANETGNGSLDKYLSIDRLKIYQSNTADLDPGIGNLSELGSLRWDLDGITDSRVLIDSSIGSAGSGDADLNVFIPVSIFDLSYTYVYLFNANGESGVSEIKEKGKVTRESDGLLAHAGFEEWKALTGPPYNKVPDSGATISLLGAALLTLIGFRSRKN